MIRQFFPKLFGRTERGLFTIPSQEEVNIRAKEFLLEQVEQGIVQDVNDERVFYDKEGNRLIFIDGRLSGKELGEIYGDLFKN